MQWLFIFGIVYLLMNKWDLVKRYLPANTVAFFDQMRSNRGALVVHLQFFVFLFSVLYMIPFDLLGLNIQGFLYLAAMWTALIASCITIVSNYNYPPVREGWAKCQRWLQELGNSIEFHWLLYSFIFVMAPPFFAVLIIPARRAIWGVLKFATKQPGLDKVPQWKQFKPHYDQLMAREEEILVKASLLEIGLGFFFIIQLLLPDRQLLVCVLYWNFLRLRYHSLKTKKTHEAAWGMVKAKTDPYVGKIPGAEKIVGYGKAYFCKPM